MTAYAFRRRSPVVQLLWGLRPGTYLAQHRDDESGVNLYHCADEGRGFFIEVGIDDSKGAWLGVGAAWPWVLAVAVVKGADGGVFQACYRLFQVK